MLCLLNPYPKKKMDCVQVPKYFLAWMSSEEISGNGCTLPRNSPTHEPQKSRNVPCGDWEFVGIKETRCNVLIIGFWRCRLDRAKLAVPNRVTPPTSVCSRASCQNVSIFIAQRLNTLTAVAAIWVTRTRKEKETKTTGQSTCSPFFSSSTW